MVVGMALIGAGLAATLYGVAPRGSGASRAAGARIRVRTLDDAPITPRHVALLPAAVIFPWIGPETKARAPEDISDELLHERKPAV